MIETITGTGTTAAPSALKSQAEEQKSQFLRLLIAQIKGQNPLDPMDGTEFVAQLAQFSSLEELINIREVMEQVNETLVSQSNAAADANSSTVFSA